MIALVDTFPKAGAPARSLIFASAHETLEDFAAAIAEGPVEGRALFAPLVKAGKGLKHEVAGEEAVTLGRGDIRRIALFTSPGFYFPPGFRSVSWRLSGAAKARGEAVELTAAEFAGADAPSAVPARRPAPAALPIPPARADADQSRENRLEGGA